MSSTTRTNARHIARVRSGRGARFAACDPQGARVAMPTIPRWSNASSQRSKSSVWRTIASQHTPKPGSPSSGLSKAGTIRTVATPLEGSARRRPTSRPTPYHPVRPDPTPLALRDRDQDVHAGARPGAGRVRAARARDLAGEGVLHEYDDAGAVHSHGLPAADIRNEQAPAPASRSTGLQPTRSIRRDDDVRARRNQ